ncbi:MAG: beta-xylosidase/endoglucanase [Ignavibacteria bacterium]|nr:MAG: beta-xylosidase/endoglucanase [Ignavibacteria bacterium]KAF0161026.1 MAG: beta-xylosidase/endoglucanase [Ignavibacteria bacterium]
MKKYFHLILFVIALMSTDYFAQQMPLVYDVENTGSDCPKPYLPTISELPTILSLPDPFMWSDGRGRITNFSDWRYRRAEIAAEIENYEIGEKPPRPADIKATYANGVLTVIVTVNGISLTLNSQIILPSGNGPFAAIIGMNSSNGSIPSNIFTSRKIAQITFSHNQVTTYGNPRNTDPYYKLYPHLNIDNTGQYSAWAWGVSRIIDGLELVKDVLPIDTKRLAVSGCSYAGKLALFAGAFDERIALTFAIESGGGGYTTWRYSEEINKTVSVETLGKTDYNWFRESMKQFSNAVNKLPFDHHELMAMVAPRALFVTGNPDFVWLADESGHVGSNAAKEVWKSLGVPDRFGYSIVGGHGHCSVPNSQIPEIEAFVEKFLLSNAASNTNVATTPYKTNLNSWITWTTPVLKNGTSFFGKSSLVYPANLQKGLDKSITFKWKQVKDAQKYGIQLSLDAAFTQIVKTDSTETDTTKTISGLIDGKQYFWRVQVKSANGIGPWTDTWSFTTYIALPAAPQLVSAVPYPGRQGWVTFKWRKVKEAEQYFLQISFFQNLSMISQSTTTSDTSATLLSLDEGQKYFWRVQSKNAAGYGPWSELSSIIVDVKVENVPTEYSLGQNYPNPFNPTTSISFQIAAFSHVSLKVYDVLGREIATLVDEFKQAGTYSSSFYTLRSSFASGVYFYRLTTPKKIITKKMVITK